MSGAVRFRSNVVIIRDEHEWRLALSSVPGEVAGDYLSFPRMTRGQLIERQLYQPCVVCHRSLWRIARHGCTRSLCRSRERAAALADVRTMYSRARGQIEMMAAADDRGREQGRGPITPIREWHPDGDGAGDGLDEGLVPAEDLSARRAPRGAS